MHLEGLTEDVTWPQFQRCNSPSQDVTASPKMEVLEQQRQEEYTALLERYQTFADSIQADPRMKKDAGAIIEFLNLPQDFDPKARKEPEKVLDDVWWKDLNVTWHRTIAGDAAEILSKISWGKAFEEVLKVAEQLEQRLKNPAAHCDTRFAQAERKVYENLAGNYQIIVTHNEALESADLTGLSDGMRQRGRERAAEAKHFLKELRKMAFVVRVLGLSDLLRHVKNLSLFQQTVNTLPWEVQEKEIYFHEVLLNTVLTEELHSNTLTEENFPLLYKHQAELTTKMYLGVNLTVAPAHHGNGRAAFLSLLRGLARWCDVTREYFKTRFQHHVQIGWMAKCMDLRKLCLSPCQLSVHDKEHLKKIYDWATLVGKIELPTFDELWEQHKLVKVRLMAARMTEGYASKWKDASGTVLMEDLFTDERLYEDVQDWLYLFQLCCALKIQNEAVVEGMGSTIDRHATSVTGLTQDKYVKESFIEYNGPAPSECDGFFTAALGLHFKGKPWKFHHTDPGNGSSAATGFPRFSD
ncbi:hypothetical protein CYMTET_2730 [Cymbomonas tetramitiformis]|uniref:Uncharacterized protein n=1 Tax=Cymbomonas tetramitiformis TaxID=36881 RepID=A0AAE0LM88_9CHLO|nr:hypothetical protein CYMTET_2730 [Cymbomonas tetramitiformis]